MITVFFQNSGEIEIYSELIILLAQSNKYCLRNVAWDTNAQHRLSKPDCLEKQVLCLCLDEVCLSCFRERLTDS